MKKFIPFGLVVTFSFLLFVFRVLPHQANLSPVLALCLFAGFLGKGRWYSLFLPLGALFLSDLQMGLYPGWAINYICYVGVVFIGAKMTSRFLGVLGSGLVAATLFFLISNFGVWVYSGMYSPTVDGLLQCYRLALPFFRSTLVSTLSSVTLFYLVAWALAQSSVRKERESVSVNG